jgi:hypothetical protein
VVDSVKEFRQINIDCVMTPLLNDALNLPDGLLDHPVNDGWDTQSAFTAIRFIDLNTPDG